VGLGVSVAFIAMLKLLASWYEERLFATLTGLAMLVGNVGSMLAGAPLAWLMQDYGWRQIFTVAGLLSLVIAAASHLWVRDRPAGMSHKAATHEHASLWHALAEVLRNRQTWPGFFLTFGIGGGLFGFGGLWAVPYFTQAHGLSRALASNHMSLYFLGFAVGCLFIGTLSDRLGRRLPVLRAGMALYAVSWLAWLLPGAMPLALSYLLCMVMGLFTASLVLSWACAKEVNPPQLSGMATSVVNVGAFLGGAIMQPLAGWMMDQYWLGEMLAGVRQYPAVAWQVLIGLMFASTVLGAVATLFMRETGCRNIWQR
jgi:MFS family permease